MAENNDPRPQKPMDKCLATFKRFWEDLTQNKGMANYAKSNTRDMLAYILLLTGLLLLFFESSFGDTLIGVIFGLYFSNELYQSCKNYELFIQQQGFVKCIVFGALLLALFISAPFIFIGAAAAVIVRRLLDI
jgi:hypothetical protein